MGNCWASSSNDHTHHVSPKPSSPDHFNENSKTKTPPLGEIITPNLKVFTFAELKSATRNFRSDTEVGAGRFGTVFKGRVDEYTYAPSRPGFGMAVAVKNSNDDSIEGIAKWQSEVKFLGRFSHPNLLKLIGYCSEEKQFLLVYEYMSKGSLESHLFRHRADPLSWEQRINIALGAAQGLAFLHKAEKQPMYRDFKSANILLDGDYNAKLADFGLERLDPSDEFSYEPKGFIGTYGSEAPKYLATGHLDVKSDVYGFGVMLLELLSGRRVIDMNRPNGEHNMVDWGKALLADKRKLRKIMDSRLECQFPPKAAVQTAQLILKCLESDPRKRPSMQEVLETLQVIVLWK